MEEPAAGTAVGAGTCVGTAGAQLAMMETIVEKTIDQVKPPLPINTASPFHKQDMTLLNYRYYKTNFAVCYNLATMLYENSGSSFLCIGVRGFDTEGTPRTASVARR